MTSSAHERQREAWEVEHSTPHVLPQLHSTKPARGVVQFWSYLVERKAAKTSGIEFGCGKGRNVIWLAQQGVAMQGTDFSSIAVAEARRRAEAAAANTAAFRVADAIEPWPYESNSFDFAVDCFASCDLESATGRAEAIRECHRVVRPGGYALAYLLSTDDAYFIEKRRQSPADEPNAFYHPSTGKYEKSFTVDEIIDLYGDFGAVAQERFAGGFRLNETYYANLHWWCVFRKRS